MKNNNKNNNWVWKLILLWIFYILAGIILGQFLDEKTFKIVSCGLIIFFIICHDRIMVERKYGKSRDNNNTRNDSGDGNSPGRNE
jgi:F0F1-type ATP synthase assembly protein I